jgi:predicted transcriptional regulator
MARKLEKQKALVMREKGMSYTEIQKELGVSKSTLSGWLSHMPLSDERIRLLRDKNPRRIERYINTMRKKREEKLQSAYNIISGKIKKISKRELFISGLFLYWGEGSKTRSTAVGLTNTNPYMLMYFIQWLNFFNVPKNKLKVHLHLYLDMDIDEKISFWSKVLHIPISQFRKPYIKKSKASSITYTRGFCQGTCTVIVDDANISAQVLMGIQYLQNMLKIVV